MIFHYSFVQKNIFLLFLLLYSFPFNAQSRTEIKSNTFLDYKFSFEHYTTRQGLSQNSVYTILQDKKGFLWFGTQGGINRFNGYEFKIFEHSTFDSTSLSHNYVNKLYEDSKSRIWACTEGGLSLFNPITESFTNFVHDDYIRQSIIDNYVWTIFEDSRGSFWIGTKKGLSRFDPIRNTFEVIKIISPKNEEIPLENVMVIVEDRRNNIWFGTRGNGIYRIERKEGKAITGSSVIAEQYNPGNGDVRSIVEDSYGNIWAGTFGGGLYRYDETKNIFYIIPVNPSNTPCVNPNVIRTLFQDPGNPGILWLGTEEDGIMLIDIKQNKSIKINNDPNTANGLRGSMVYSFYRSRSGIIWIGSNEGVNLLNLNANIFDHIQKEKNNDEGLNNNGIEKMIEDLNGVLWIGTDGGGLNKFDRSSNKFTHYLHNTNDPSSISSNRAMVVFEDHTGTIWVGTFGGGLNKFFSKTETFRSYTYNKSDPNSIGSNYVTSIVEDKSGYLWIGTTESGINRFDPRTNRFKRYLNNPDDPASLSDNHVWILYIDKNGTLWAGTKNGGLNEMLDREKGKFKRFLHDNKNFKSINSNTIYSVFEDRIGGFWIGTIAGLDKLDRKTGEFKNFRFTEALSQFSVVGILEDNSNRLWIITGNELFRFNPKTNEFKIYDSRNGMMITDLRLWANYQNSRGEFFVGGANGFTIFSPDSLKDNKFVPPVVIDKFERFNTDNPTGFVIKERGIIYRDKIELSYKDNIFSFSFTALNYVHPGKNRYTYKLIGFNKDWINIGSKTNVTFTNIDPGSYTFLVKGSNDDGVWNEKAASIEIIISPPFWITWWFRSGVFLIIVFTIGYFVRGKLKATEKHHKEQEAFARQLIETEELERQRIANELHDSLGQNLLVIKNSLLVKQQQGQIEGNSLEETSNLVSHTIQEVRSISHNLRPHLLDQLGLTKTIKSLAKQLNDSSGINICAEIDDLSSVLEPKAEINLFRIIQESFNNIIKHSGASKAFLEIKIFPDYLNVLIKDNGKGMNLEEIRKNENYGHGFGLYGMEKRAHVFNWTYEIVSASNNGTEIKLAIPLKG